MGPVVHAVAPGVVAVVAVGCVFSVAVLATVLLARRAARRRSALAVELNRSRAQVDELGRQVEELSDAVARARRDAEQDREYVITSLTGGRDVDVPPSAGSPAVAPVRQRPPLARLVEDRVVAALARQTRTSPVRVRSVKLVVRTVAVTHGLRRALSPDVLDRAAAEAHVARRRSRRDRRRQERQARRSVRSVSTRGTGPGPARAGQDVA